MNRFLLGLLLALPLITQPAAGQSNPPSEFIEGIDMDPAAPQPWQPEHWDLTVHLRDLDAYHALHEVEAAHGADCGAPPATHSVHTYEDAVFVCKGHMMTAINAPGYGVIYLTPDRLLDFSAGEAVVRFDMSTLRSTGRDWIDLWISPFEDHLQLPLDDWLPDLQGDPRRSIHIRMDMQLDNSRFIARRIDNHEAEEIPGTEESWQGYEAFLTPDARRRDQFELRISRTHLAFGMPAYDFWWIDTDMPALDWGAGVVQLGHHSYNPTKDCSGPCGPTTWHWDNFMLSPATPFTLIQADQRYADATTDGIVRFSAPAPEQAFLRFTGIGDDLAVSFDGGVSWQPAIKQEQESDITEHFASFFMPVPAGTQSVRFQGDAFWGGEWHVRNLSIWSAASSTSVGTEEASPAVSSHHLGSPYPNPGNGEISIPFELAESGRVLIEAFDLLGRRQRVLVDATLPAGSHQTTVDTATLPAGAYFIRMQTGDTYVTRVVEVRR